MSDIIEANVPIVKVVCNNCLHYHRKNMTSFSCDAFEEIPKEILAGKEQHIKPLPQQVNSIVFEPIKN